MIRRPARFARDDLAHRHIPFVSTNDPMTKGEKWLYGIVWTAVVIVLVLT